VTSAGTNQRQRRLAELMIEHGIGVAEEHAYSVKKIDSDYFEES
jgi:restriction system protein